jgi:Protein of unknown function (DUF3592)
MPMPPRALRPFDYLRIAFSIAAVVFILFGLYTMRETSRARGWAAVDGHVVSSTVNAFTGRTGTTWRPLVVYSYSVGGVRFMSTRIAFHSLARGTRDEAGTIAARYPPGRGLRVLYDPQDPEQSVLEPGPNPWLFIIAGGVFSMLAVWMRILRARADKRRTPGR